MQVFNGISLSSILLLAAIGPAITFGLMGVVNMAHGELIMVGAYMDYLLQVAFKALPSGVFGLYVPVAVVLSFVVAALAGIEEELLRRHLYSRVSAMVANCVKTVPLSQTVGQRLLFDAAPAGRGGRHGACRELRPARPLHARL